jgi:hypothetical protein
LYVTLRGYDESVCAESTHFAPPDRSEPGDGVGRAGKEP